MGEQFGNVLSWSDVPKLMKFYEDSGIDYYSAYLFLENINRWHLLFPESDSFILSPGGKINDYGTFMIVYPFNEKLVNVIFEDTNPDPTEIKPFLSSCIEFLSKKWTQLVFGPIKKKYWPVLYETASQANLDRLHSTISRCYFMNKEVVKEIPMKCPENMYLSQLKVEHADLINSLWPHKFENSVDMIRTVIHRNGGIGVFLKENDELVSWGLHGLYNGPGNVQTMEEHKRKGLGTLVTVAVSKFVAEKELHPLFFVVNENIPAQKMYAKLSFNIGEENQWCLWRKQ